MHSHDGAPPPAADDLPDREFKIMEAYLKKMRDMSPTIREMLGDEDE